MFNNIKQLWFFLVDVQNNTMFIEINYPCLLFSCYPLYIIELKCIMVIKNEKIVSINLNKK